MRSSGTLVRWHILRISFIQYNMLKLEIPEYYQVQQGQTLQEIAYTFCLSERVLARENGLTKEVQKGQILFIPKSQIGNRYTVKEGDTKSLLCGSEENFFRRNGTDCFYIGMKVIL